MNATQKGRGRGAARGRSPGGTLLGLQLDGDRLEVVALRRTNGSIEVQRSLVVTLSLNPLTNEAALVGREIRKHLDEAGLRERRCVVGLPLSWVLTVQVALPDLAEEDVAGFLEIEAERGFPYAPDTLVMGRSVFRTPDGGRQVRLAAVPRDHVARLEAALVAAQLRPVSFTLGITALARGGEGGGEPVVVLAAGAHGVGLLVAAGGGVAALRSLEAIYEEQAGGRELRPEALARELRITLGQLPGELGGALRRVRVVGKGEVAEELEEAVRGRASGLGLQVEVVREYGGGEFAARLPAGTAVSPALSLAACGLSGVRPEFEFLPPKVTAWQQITERYASRKLVWAGTAAAVLAVGLAGALLVQQAQLWYWGSKWRAMQAQVGELESLQAKIRQYRPWFDASVPTLSMLRRLTEAFPEDGTVSARSVEWREPASVTCMGTAQNREALLRVLEKLRAVGEVAEVKLEVMRGKAPLEFSFNFQWLGQGGSRS